jgi:hypothetical protein
MKKVFIAVVCLFGMAALLLPSAAVFGSDGDAWEICDKLDKDSSLWTAAGCGNLDDTIDVRIEGVMAVVFWAVAILAVIMIIYGGMQYVLSQGDAQKTKKAKDTIMYAVIGLVVALAARVIIYFVFSAVGL